MTSCQPVLVISSSTCLPLLQQGKMIIWLRLFDWETNDKRQTLKQIKCTNNNNYVLILFWSTPASDIKTGEAHLPMTSRQQVKHTCDIKTAREAHLPMTSRQQVKHTCQWHEGSRWSTPVTSRQQVKPTCDIKTAGETYLWHQDSRWSTPVTSRQQVKYTCQWHQDSRCSDRLHQSLSILWVITT